MFRCYYQHVVCSFISNTWQFFKHWHLFIAKFRTGKTIIYNYTKEPSSKLALVGALLLALCHRLGRTIAFLPLRKLLKTREEIKMTIPITCSQVQTFLKQTKDKNRVVAFLAVEVIDIVSAPYSRVIHAEHDDPRNPVVLKSMSTTIFFQTVQVFFVAVISIPPESCNKVSS